MGFEEGVLRVGGLILQNIILDRSWPTLDRGVAPLPFNFIICFSSFCRRKILIGSMTPAYRGTFWFFSHFVLEI